MSSSAGKRAKSKPTTGDRIKALDQRLGNNEMAVRVMQMVSRQIGDTLNPIQNDLGELASRQRDLQYILLAVQELSGFKKEDIDKKAIELQVKDFEEMSSKEDVEKGYSVAEVVAEDSAVIISSKTPAEEVDKGIMRSKLLLSEIQLPTLKEALLGKKVGDKTEADVNGVQHTIEVLGIRTVPAPEPVEEVADQDVTPLGVVANTGENEQETTQ